MTERIDLKISGSSKLPGGEYGGVYISGAGKIVGDLRCDSLMISGSGKVEGGAEVGGKIRCSGAGKIQGLVTAQSLESSGSFSTEAGAVVRELCYISGSFNTEGDLRAQTLTVHGSCSVDGEISTGVTEIYGVLKTEGGVEAERFYSRGSVRIEKLLNAEKIDLELKNENRIGSIGGSAVKVKPAYNSLFRSKPGLTVGLIEADVIELACTEAQTVRGTDVVVGPDCRIGRVEYSGTLSVDPKSEVLERVKV